MNLRLISIALSSLALSTSLLCAADLTTYRNFRLGMSVAEITQQTGAMPQEVKLISSRPERIDELDWKMNWTPPAAGVRADPFREIDFRFYNGALSGLTVTYDPDRTAGLTDADMVEALTRIYGGASKAAVPDVAFNSGYSKTVKVLAHWEDAQSQLSAVRLPYEAGFGIILLSKNSTAKSEKAMLESDRLDRVEAPQRELAIEAKRAAEAQTKDEKSRSTNKPGFTP